MLNLLPLDGYTIWACLFREWLVIAYRKVIICFLRINRFSVGGQPRIPSSSAVSFWQIIDSFSTVPPLKWGLDSAISDCKWYNCIPALCTIRASSVRPSYHGRRSSSSTWIYCSAQNRLRNSSCWAIRPASLLSKFILSTVSWLSVHFCIGWRRNLVFRRKNRSSGERVRPSHCYYIVNFSYWYYTID